jgi:arylsulfatase A-like enzyme
MTGLLPHNHGVLEVIHCVDEDQSNLRTDKPHWAQRLEEAGYRTGYFGKWHVERTNNLQSFGWQINGSGNSELYRRHRSRVLKGSASVPKYSLSRFVDLPHGYERRLFYAVTDQPPEKRGMGITTSLALEFLREVTQDSKPWCCFVSISEPHDPFVAGQEAFKLYDVNGLELPPNAHDDLSDRPGIYRKAAKTWADMTDRERREAAACYYASITEIDRQFGRLIHLLEEMGKLENTIIVLTSDHGELLGAHGLYCKNYSAFEEIYNIPLIISGPGIAEGVVTDARVGLHDLCPTLLELVDLDPIDVPDSRSFASVLRDPQGEAESFTMGYAEYHGTRYKLTQRVVWDGHWKFILNGFDFDELYNLDEDPYEMKNLAMDAAFQDQVCDLMVKAWRIIRDTGDHALYNSHYPALRVAPFGPLLTH